MTVKLPFATVLAILAIGNAHAMPSHSAKVKVIEPFYQSLNAGSDAETLIKQNMAQDWLSCSGLQADTCKSRDQVISAIKGFHQAVPDLKWAVKQTWVSGNQVIVQSEASGTPAGVFFGAPHTGKSFRIMAIDIHTLGRGGKVVKSEHIEDWAGALQQLR